MDKEARHILLVEDNPDDVLLTRRAIKKAKLLNEMRVVTDGQQALDYLFCKNDYSERDPYDLPGVVLLDLNLPKVGGLEVLDQIRKSPLTKLVPVCILTSSKEESDLIQGYEKGCNSYVRKPVDFNEFLDAVKHMGMYWMVLNELPSEIR
ncbi:response regulator [Dongshaea marina]|uniref:response regulator n=1 Tax=Dongshaea marina TaxID=2047966 RepID=UPI000D3E11AF|nr:response regulator [Dongshaea marina]